MKTNKHTYTPTQIRTHPPTPTQTPLHTPQHAYTQTYKQVNKTKQNKKQTKNEIYFEQTIHMSAVEKSFSIHGILVYLLWIKIMSKF